MREGFRLAVVGGGRMGEALVGGFISSELLEPAQIAVVEVDPERRERVRERFGVSAEADVAAAVAGAGAVLLAVKPQQIDEVAGALGALLAPEAIVISIAAGVSTARLESLLGGKAREVVRVMPNQAALVGRAVSAIAPGAGAGPAAVELAEELMGSVGRTVVLPEKLMNASTALNGSGPAYVYLFAEALIEAGVRQGLTREQAAELVIGTIQGAGEVLAHGGHPAELIDAVASPGGTTIAAIEALEKAGFRAALFDAVNAAVKRSEELG